MKKGENLSADFGKYEAQGKRDEMEDVSTVMHINIFPDGTPCLFIGVYDGHSGRSTADYVSRQLPKELGTSMTSITITHAAIENAFMNTDEKLRVSEEDFTSGSTANICLICPTQYICANIGDTRCVLARNKESIPLSFDHNPHLITEMERINTAGSYVRIEDHNGRKISRVNGQLAVARAFGDFEFKKSNKSNRAAKDYAVTAFPEITEIQRTRKDDFIILACDGLWDVLTNEEAVDFVYACIEAEETALEAAKSLVFHALRKGTTDNVSCIVVFL